MTGHHVTADLASCLAEHPALTDAMALRALCLDAVQAAGLTAVGELFHVFPAPGGVTGVVLLAESHLAVHTWPERGVVTLDVYVCNVSVDNSAAALAVVETLIAAFAPHQVQRQHWVRGGADAAANESAVPGGVARPSCFASAAATATAATDGVEASGAPGLPVQSLPAAARPAATPSV
jgi:S-adenosylmethionine decarboxylase